MAPALGFGETDSQLRLSRPALVLATSLAPMGSTLVAQTTARPAHVIPIQVVPNDYEWNLGRLRLNVQAVTDVRRWYARALRGPTFRADPLVVLQSRYTFAQLSDSNFQAWWPLLGKELADYGLNWQDSANFKLLFLVQGAGAWAGGDTENGGIERVADAGRVDRGDYGGMVVIGDSSAAGVQAGVCPMDGIIGGTAWWCNWETYRGTIAHELGHTWGIPHPDAFKPKRDDGTPEPWDCQTDGNTVMQCHWGFPYDSLLTYEAEHFRSLRFFSLPTASPYTLLTEALPLEAKGDVAVRRLGTAIDEKHALVWVDDLEQGSALGYPWAVRLGAESGARWPLPAECGAFITDVGRARASGGRGTAIIRIDGVVRARLAVGGEHPREVVVPYCQASTIELAVEGQRRFRAAFGNPRVVPRPGEGG